MKSLIPVLLLTLLAGCQSAGAPLAPASFKSAASVRLTQPSLPFTAKIVDEDAENLAKAWSPARALTHVLALNIVSDGTPHPAVGSFVFSFIDKVHRERGFQVTLRPGMQPVTQEIESSKLPQTEPLEIRAWGLDSSKAILKAREYFGDVSLKRFELTAVEHRLIWSFGPKAMVEAFDGALFVPTTGAARGR